MTSVIPNSSNNTASPTATTPRTPSARATQAAAQPVPQQLILTTGSVPSEVTHLFRTKRVSDIRQYESRIRTDADEKSEALRHLLGTRYRDLLLAADRISSMCDGAKTSVRDTLHNVCNTSAKLRDELNSRSSSSSSQQQKQSDRSISTISSSSSDADLARRRSIHIVGSRLKHIVDSPEVLYAYLEAGELYEAASRYVVAQSNYNAIADASTDESAVASKFASTRWKPVSSFKSQIVTAAERRLITSGLNSNDYAKVFAAILLLQADECDIVSVVDKLLSPRTTWLAEVRHRQSRGDASDAMKDIAIVVRDTVSCMASLFWHSKTSTDDKQENDYIQSESIGVEELVRKVDENCAKQVIQARERGSLNAAVVSWTSNVRSWLQNNGDALLATATTSREVAQALKAVDDILSDSQWVKDCQAALQQQPDFVFDIFKPFISARAAVVAEECVQQAVKRVLTDVGSAWNDVDGVSDIGKGMWAAMSGQAVSLGGGGDSTMNHAGNRNTFKSTSARNLDEERDVARMLVYNGAVANVVDTFEASMKEALTDVRALAQRVPSVITAFDSAVAKNVPRVFDDLQQRVEGAVKDESKLDSDEREVAMERCLFAARAATALAEAECIADALRFIAISSYGQNSTTDSYGERRSSGRGKAGLVEMQVRAAAVSGLGYSVWAKLLCEGLATDINRDLIWEKRLIVEMGWGDKSDEMDEQKSANETAAVRFPTTASTAVVNMLLKTCKAASKAGGFALPVEALEFVRDAMTKVVVRVYREVLKIYVENETEDVNSGGKKENHIDTAVMQMLFDVQCLTILLGDIVIDDKDSSGGTDSIISARGTTSLKQLEGEIQARIDPIDLASCRKALRESVGSYVARTGTLYGPVARRRDGRSAWAGGARAGINTSAASNLVSLAPSVQRFTYLPAPMPSTYTNTGGVGTAGIHAKAVVGALRNEAAAAAAAAASGGVGRKRESLDASVAGYASKMSESVGRLGRGFFESLTRKVT